MFYFRLFVLVVINGIMFYCLFICIFVIIIDDINVCIFVWPAAVNGAQLKDGFKCSQSDAEFLFISVSSKNSIFTLLKRSLCPVILTFLVSSSVRGCAKITSSFLGSWKHPPPLCHPPVIKLVYPRPPYVISVFDDTFQNSYDPPLSLNIWWQNCRINYPVPPSKWPSLSI